MHVHVQTNSMFIPVNVLVKRSPSLQFKWRRNEGWTRRERERELTDDRGQRLQGKRKQTSRKSFSVSLSLFFFFSCEFWCSVSLRAPPAGRGQTVMRLWWTFKTLCALNGYFLILHKVQLSGSVYKRERMKREYSRVCVLCTFVYTPVCVCVPEGISWRCAPVPRSVK